MIVSVKLKGGPMNGYQTSIRQGQTRHQIRQPIPRKEQELLPPITGEPETNRSNVEFRVGEYRQGATVGTFEWAGWL